MNKLFSCATIKTFHIHICLRPSINSVRSTFKCLKRWGKYALETACKSALCISNIFPIRILNVTENVFRS